MTQFLTQDSLIPPYMAFPRFLLDKDGLSETAKILYTILLDRARDVYKRQFSSGLSSTFSTLTWILSISTYA